MPRVYYHYDGTCPYCSVYAHFTDILNNVESLSDSKTHIDIVTCDNCEKKLVAFFERKVKGANHHYNIVSTFPLVSPGKPPDGVPLRIWNDYTEGITCIHANAPKGAVVLFRRATQSLAKELGANRSNLYEQFNELKASNKITDHLHDIATEIRSWGNFGAHPDEDLLTDVTIEEAKEMKEIFWMLLDYTLIQKAKVSKIQAKRKAKKRK